MFTYNSTSSYGFAPSEAANLEYSILSTILGHSPESAGSPPNAQTPSQSQAASFSAQQSPSAVANGTWPASSNGFNGGSQLAIQPADASVTLASTATTSNGYSAPYTSSSTYTSNGTTSPRTQYADYNSSSQQVGSSSLANYAGQTAPAGIAPAAVNIVAAQAAIPTARSTPTTLIDRTISAGTASWAGPSASELGLQDSNSVYKSVTKPYDYTQGYHFLMKHLASRYVIPNFLDLVRRLTMTWLCNSDFDKNDILRIVRALAIFRPSLIALQMPMSEEDEVFIEKCFQRSLVVCESLLWHANLRKPRSNTALLHVIQELEKLVSFSGTPTLAWRRTGEICLVGPEFCMLTGWEREELIGRKKYVYEVRIHVQVTARPHFLIETCDE